jgi:hypothetical protein
LPFLPGMATKRKTSSRRRKSASKRTSSGKRELLKGSNATLLATRTAKGRFKEMDERSRSLAGDRRRKATTKAKSGYGDRGDRRAA